MAQIFKEHAQMCHWLLTDKSFIHVRIPSQALNVLIFTDLNEAFSASVAAIPEVLENSEYPEYLSMFLHEPLPSLSKATNVAAT